VLKIEKKTLYYRMKKKNINLTCLRPWPLLLAGEKGVEGNVGDLHNLEPDSGDITDGVTLSAESGDQDLIVLLDEVQATVLGDEGGDLLGILDQLNPHALPDGRVRLLGLDTDLLKDDALGVRGSTEGIGLPPGAQVSFFVVLIGPNLVPSVGDVLTSGLDSRWLTHFEK